MIYVIWFDVKFILYNLYLYYILELKKHADISMEHATLCIYYMQPPSDHVSCI